MKLHYTKEELLDMKLNLLKSDPCDKYDYLIATVCGVIGGLIDSIFVGSPLNSKIQHITDSQTDHMVQLFAKMMGWNPRESQINNVNSAIGFLEKQFPVNYDQRYAIDTANQLRGMSTKNHHLMSLSHSPDIIGLFFSILNQFTSTSSFVSNGKLITIDTETFELQGNNFIEKIFCGIANWFGHLMSDVAGSSGSVGRGSGIAIPFFEMFQFCQFGSFQVGKYRQTLAQIATQAYQTGYDFRFGLSMSIPALVTDLSIRLVWSIRRYFQSGKPLEECIPTNTHANLRMMLLIGNGGLCAIDTIDALSKSKGNAVLFFTRINIIAWGKLILSALKELELRCGFTYEDLSIQFRRVNKMFDEYLEKLKSINYESYKQELEELQNIQDILSTTTSDLSSVYVFLEKHHSNLQFKNFDEFDSKMKDKNFVLEI